MQAIHFPGESPAYRKARDELLKAERELRSHVEKVAAVRRQLPLGGAVPEDYAFEEAAQDVRSPVRSVRLSELFAPGLDSLVVYSLCSVQRWNTLARCAAPSSTVWTGTHATLHSV